jgi:hypothetical protein
MKPVMPEKDATIGCIAEFESACSDQECAHPRSADDCENSRLFDK